MLSWVDKMVPEYIEGRQDMKKRSDQVDRSNPVEMNDLKQFNSMIDSMTYSLEWMTTGRQPNTYRGMDEKSVYQKRSYENIDLIPDIAEQLEENDINKKHLFMSREEKVILADILSSFSLRERQCYILHVGQKKSMSEIAYELGVSKSMVQQSIRRAKKKVEERMDKKSMIYA